MLSIINFKVPIQARRSAVSPEYSRPFCIYPQFQLPIYATISSKYSFVEEGPSAFRSNACDFNHIY